MKLFKIISLMFLILSANGKSYCFKYLPLDKVCGSIIASALGDAMGKVTEFLSVDQIFKKYPNGIRSFKDFKEQDFWLIPSYVNKPKNNYERLHFAAIWYKQAPYTDDTQMARMVLEACLQSKKENLSVDKTMEILAQKFVNWSKDPDGGLCQGRAPGNTCLIACKELEKRISTNTKSKGWWICGKGSDAGIATEGGCGSVMRAWPIGLVFHDNLKKVEEFAVAQSLLTHRHPKAQAASAALAVGIAMIINNKKIYYVTEKMIKIAGKYDKETAELMRWAKNQAFKSNLQDIGSDINSHFNIETKKADNHKVVFDKLRSWAAHEAIAAALYIFLVSSNDVHKAIYLGVHTPGDSDSIAAMAGALVGANCGICTINENDIDLLEKHDELIELGTQIKFEK